MILRGLPSALVGRGSPASAGLPHLGSAVGFVTWRPSFSTLRVLHPPALLLPLTRVSTLNMGK